MSSPSAKSLDAFVERISALSESIVDSYFVCDNDRTIVAHNTAFAALVGETKSVVGQKCYELLRLSICKNACIAGRCLDEHRVIQLENIEGVPADKKKAFTLTGTPIYGDDGQPLGALEIQHDISELVDFQEKFQTTLKQHAQTLGQVEGELSRRTTELIDAHRTLRQTRLELLEYKKGTLP